MLPIRFLYRKNIRSGRIFASPCLRNDASREALGRCPAHQSWPRICQRADTGNGLIPSMNADKCNRLLKATTTALKFDQGGRYSPHAFCGGAANEIKNSDSILAAILKAGIWMSAISRHYIDLQAGESRYTTAVLLAGLSSGSEDPCPPPRKRPSSTKKTIARRTLKAVMAIKRDQVAGPGSEESDIPSETSISERPGLRCSGPLLPCVFRPGFSLIGL